MKIIKFRVSLIILCSIIFCKLSFAQKAFVNPISEGADPWVIKTDSCYYFCSTVWVSDVVVWKSKKLTDYGIRRFVWSPPTSGWNKTDIWAPELHYIQGKWYIFYSACNGEYDYVNGNQVWKNQRSGVLECLSQDPTSASWVDKGMLYTGDDIDNWSGTVDDNIWAIDPTPLEMNGKLYCIWSGWDSTANVLNNGFTQQNLYIAEMKNPYTMKTNRVKIAEPTYPWEIGQVQRVNEGPEVLRHGYYIYVIYSGPDYWTIEYKMGQLSIPMNADPMNPNNWTKKSVPVFQGTDQVYSVGHGSMTTSPDGTENWLLYRSKQYPTGGWERDIRLQRFTWNQDGSPNFGVPSPAGTILNVPSGEFDFDNVQINEFSDKFNDSSRHWDNWVYYGWESDIKVLSEMLWLGCGYRDLNAGEKVLLRGYDWKDFTLETDISIVEGSKDAGVIFRVIELAFGKYSLKGYYIGLDVENDKIYLARMDGNNKTILTEVTMQINLNFWYHLKVETDSSNIKIYVDNEIKIEFNDSQNTFGMVGLRVDETTTAFDNFQIVSKNLVGIKSENYPENFNLKQNYPNPFNNSTIIYYQIYETDNVSLNLYDISGHLIEELINETKPSGNYQLRFSSDELASGLYLYRLESEGKTIVKKMMLLK